MGQEQTFTGTEAELVRQLVGGDTPLPDAVAEQAGLDALEFFANQGANVESVSDGSDSLELALGGRFFFSVHKFLWDAASAIVGLAVALAAQQPPGALTSAVAIVKSLLASISVFNSDTVEFQAYTAVAALQKAGVNRTTVDNVSEWLHEHDREIQRDELASGITVLVERQLLRKSADGTLRIRW